MCLKRLYKTLEHGYALDTIIDEFIRMIITADEMLTKLDEEEARQRGCAPVKSS